MKPEAHDIKMDGRVEQDKKRYKAMWLEFKTRLNQWYYEDVGPIEPRILTQIMDDMEAIAQCQGGE